jgi:hypothetical protein
MGIAHEKAGISAVLEEKSQSTAQNQETPELSLKVTC